MKVIFLKDYGGRDTGEVRYHKGQILEVGSVNANYVEWGIYEVVPEPEPAIEYLPEDDAVVDKPKVVVTKPRRVRRSK